MAKETAKRRKQRLQDAKKELEIINAQMEAEMPYHMLPSTISLLVFTPGKEKDSYHKKLISIVNELICPEVFKSFSIYVVAPIEYY